MSAPTSTPVSVAPLLTEQQFQYHLEEYRQLRAEIISYGKIQFDSFIYALIANGGIVAWLLTNKAAILEYGPWAVKAAMLVPFFVAALAFYWSRFYGGIISAIGRYGVEVERRVVAPGLGWENFLAGKDERVRGAQIPRRMTLGWAILMAADLILAILV